MFEEKKNNFLFNNVSTLKGVGPKLSIYLKNKKIVKINDLIWDFPYSFTDRSNLVSTNKLEIGKICTIKVQVLKYNFPRIRNLPNKINCSDSKGSIDLVFFNSREGYLRKILPINEWVVISGKVGFFKKKYQITNPEYIGGESKLTDIAKKIPKYNLTEGLNEKAYRRIIDQVINNIPDFSEWHDHVFLKKMNFLSWKNSILEVHDIKKEKDICSNEYRRLAYDEIFSHLLVLSENRKKIKKIKKNQKN